MSRFLRLFTLWLWGGFAYCYVVEPLYRGYSHWTMFILGGFCFLILGGINIVFPWELGLVWQMLIGAGAITAAELMAGIVINVWLGLGVWDYSDMPLNVLGQICLPYSVAWFGLSAVGILLDDYLRWKLYGEDKPGYNIF